MSVDAAVERLRSEADEPGWEVDPDDDWGLAVITTVGRQLKLRREAVGMRAAEFGVAEEWTLLRPLGGRAVLRQQLEHLLEAAQLRNVELQVMPMDRDEHAGVDGGIEVLKSEDGSAVGRSPAVANGRPVSDAKQLRILELRYGIIRAQALTPRESTAFIEQLLGET
ncbi:Scr1 family TA system antitoxin-like transcriptional regulator [Streptomyces shenzhenensis]|uniref:Scr1 family TA system antitoxin-like transcriptional regulator n=1 Tax=Streptomyces shenzhenensis TaxID=943815 RepID=UPI0015F08330|nr:Scr1 family TA system antitoxin-like transcriptional regulator [Streptomyces shenzhenensis]